MPFNERKPLETAPRCHGTLCHPSSVRGVVLHHRFPLSAPESPAVRIIGASRWRSEPSSGWRFFGAKVSDLGLKTLTFDEF